MSPSIVATPSRSTLPQGHCLRSGEHRATDPVNLIIPLALQLTPMALCMSPIRGTTVSRSFRLPAHRWHPGEVQASVQDNSYNQVPSPLTRQAMSTSRMGGPGLFSNSLLPVRCLRSGEQKVQALFNLEPPEASRLIPRVIFMWQVLT